MLISYQYLSYTQYPYYAFIQHQIHQKEPTNLQNIYQLIERCLSKIKNPTDPLQKSLIAQQKKNRQSILSIPWSLYVEQIRLAYQTLFVLLDISPTKNLFHILISILQDTECLQYLPSLPNGFIQQNQHLIALTQRLNLPNDKILQLYDHAAIAQFNLYQVYLVELQGNFIKAFELRIHLYRKYHYQEIFDWISNQIKNQSEETFKNQILNHLATLAQFNPQKTRDLIKQYFHSSDISVLQKLVEFPQVQLDYLQNILNHEQKIDSEILKLHIKLLCQLHPEQVLAELKSRDYPLDDVLNICRKYKATDSVVYILERQGAIKEAIEERVQNIKICEQFFEEVCQLCERHHDEIWIFFANKIIDLVSEVKINQFYIQEVFERWTRNCNIYIFLDAIKEDFNMLDCSQLQNSFNLLYNDMNFQQNVYMITIKSMKESIKIKQKELSNAYGKGIFVAGYCHDCWQNINEGIVQFCGHHYHTQCIQKFNQQCIRCMEDPLQHLDKLKIKFRKIAIKSEDNLKFQFEQIEQKQMIHLNPWRQRLMRFDDLKENYQNDLFDLIDELE